MFSLNEQKAIELGESGERAIREQNEYDALQYAEYLRELGHEPYSYLFDCLPDSFGLKVSFNSQGFKHIRTP